MTGRSRAWLVSSGALLLFLELAIPDHSFIGAVLWRRFQSSDEHSVWLDPRKRQTEV